MTPTLKSRRFAAGCFALLAAGLACVCFSLSAFAQHGGGGGHPMGSPGGGMSPTTSFAPNERGNPRNLGRANAESRYSQPPRSGLQQGLASRWWDDRGTAHKLSLNTDQQRRMDTIFEANKPALLNLYTNLQREESNLAGLSHTDLQDEGKVFAAIDRVAHARSDLQKEYAHTSLQIRQQLTPQQLQALDHQANSSH